MHHSTHVWSINGVWAKAGHFDDQTVYTATVQLQLHSAQACQIHPHKGSIYVTFHEKTNHIVLDVNLRYKPKYAPGL